MQRHVRALALLAVMALAGCTTGGSNGTATANVNKAPVAVLNATQAPDAGRALDAMALLTQANAAISAAAAATGFVTLAGTFIAPSPSPSPTAAPAAAVTRPPGTPLGTDVQTTFFTDAANSATTVRQTVTLAGGSAGATGTDTITLVFSGLVSQTADTQARLLQLRDTTQFKLKTSQHELAESLKARTRGLKRTCTFGATTSCTLTLESESAKIGMGSTILNGAESGGGTAQFKSNGSTAALTFDWNADGSGTISLPGLNGLSATLTITAGGTLSGALTTPAGTQVSILQNATGSIYTSDNTAESDA